MKRFVIPILILAFAALLVGPDNLYSAVGRVKTWIAGETLTSSDLNAEFNNVLNNGEDLGWPATKAKDLDGQQLILDSDADTHLTADTDDQIDIAIGGADDFRFTANTFTALSGSSIATNTLNESTGAAGVTIDGILLKDSTITSATIDLDANTVTGTAAEFNTALQSDSFATLSVANLFTADQTIQSTDAGPGAGPFLNLSRNSVSPLAGDALADLRFRGEDDASADIIYALIRGEIIDPTAANPDGQMNFLTTVAGSVGNRMILAQGVQIGSPTGGDQGLGTINATALFDDGVVVLTGGQHTIWVPASGMTSPGTNGAADGSFEVGTNPNANIFATKNYDTTTVEYTQFQIQMPKNWNEGTLVGQVVWSHPSTTVNFGVIWFMECVAYANDDAANANFGVNQSMTDTGGTTDDIYISPETPALTCGGSPGAEELVLFQLHRNVGGGADTLAVDARLHGIKIHYTIDAANDN